MRYAGGVRVSVAQVANDFDLTESAVRESARRRADLVLQAAIGVVHRPVLGQVA